MVKPYYSEKMKKLRESAIKRLVNDNNLWCSNVHTYHCSATGFLEQHCYIKFCNNRCFELKFDPSINVTREISCKKMMHNQ